MTRAADDGDSPVPARRAGHTANRDHGTHRRRAHLRFFARGLNLSHVPPDALLPEEVAAGREPFVVVGAMAGG